MPVVMSIMRMFMFPMFVLMFMRMVVISMFMIVMGMFVLAVLMIVLVFFRMFHLPLRLENNLRRKAYFYLINRSNESFRSLIASSKSPSFTARTMQCFRWSSKMI